MSKGENRCFGLSPPCSSLAASLTLSRTAFSLGWVWRISCYSRARLAPLRSHSLSKKHKIQARITRETNGVCQVSITLEHSARGAGSHLLRTGREEWGEGKGRLSRDLHVWRAGDSASTSHLNKNCAQFGLTQEGGREGMEESKRAGQAETKQGQQTGLWRTTFPHHSAHYRWNKAELCCCRDHVGSAKA